MPRRCWRAPDERTKRTSDFDLRRYLEDDAALTYPVSDQRIQLRVRFEKTAAHHLYESHLSADQVLKADGENHVVLAATVRDSAEIRWWLLGFGDKVEVLGPKNLREEFSAIAGRLASMYS